jgi:hypothetical protein
MSMDNYVNTMSITISSLYPVILFTKKTHYFGMSTQTPK